MILLKIKMYVNVWICVFGFMKCSGSAYIIFSTFFIIFFFKPIWLWHKSYQRYKVALPVTGFIDVELCQLWSKTNIKWIWHFVCVWHCLCVWKVYVCIVKMLLLEFKKKKSKKKYLFCKHTCDMLFFCKIVNKHFKLCFLLTVCIFLWNERKNNETLNERQ